MTKYYPPHCILPPDVLERLARTGDDQTRAAALDTMALDRRFRLSRAEDEPHPLDGGQRNKN